jgi:hypothetical protein
MRVEVIAEKLEQLKLPTPLNEMAPTLHRSYHIASSLAVVRGFRSPHEYHSLTSKLHSALPNDRLHTVATVPTLVRLCVYGTWYVPGTQN